MNETSTKKIWGILTENYLTKSIKNILHLKRRLYHFTLYKGSSISDHLNAYTKILSKLLNVDVKIENEDKTLILLSSLSDDEYETFVLTLIHGKASLAYNEVTTALVNYELRKKDKRISSGEALSTQGVRKHSPRSLNQIRRLKDPTSQRISVENV